MIPRRIVSTGAVLLFVIGASLATATCSLGGSSGNEPESVLLRWKEQAMDLPQGEKREAFLALLGEAEEVVLSHRKAEIAAFKRIVELDRHHETSREELGRVHRDLLAKRDQGMDEFIRLRLAMRKQVTRDQWESVVE